MNVISFFLSFSVSRTLLDGSEVKSTRQAQGAPSLSDQSVGGDKEKTVNESYKKIEEKRMEALKILKGNVSILVNKENIVQDLLSIYKDPSILEKNVSAFIEGTDATGDGVIREVYSLFWDTFLSQSDGDIEHTIPIVPSLDQEDYVSIGRIITHQFVLCGIFPIRVSQASMQHAILGNASDECKIDSFLRILPQRERNLLTKALAGDGAFPTEEIIDLLDDYNTRQLPTVDNVKSLLLHISTSEFVTKPFLCLASIRLGMGQLWDNVTKEEVEALYEMSRPTAARIIATLVLNPENPKEAQINRWLERYLKGATSEILSKFLHFCTATDILPPGNGIAVDTEVMPPTAIRPKSYTCFRRLILPRNFHSYSEMRNNLEFYLRDSSIWDLNDK